MSADEGWSSLGRRSAKAKWHYFRDGRSLCGKRTIPPWWGDHPSLSRGFDDSPDNCAECKRRRAKMFEAGDVPR